ncbi:MAG: tandem-95 repeat protein, partial [Verrucomicrobia bacterium]|nr:tandem-95 repeat protein [Verrucomicrobiota bacterium]
FNIAVTPVNDAPVANAQTVSAVEDTAKAITLTGTDAEGSALTYTVVRQPSLGKLSGTGSTLTYTPDANKSGADSFTFKVNDGVLDSATATVTILVAAVNDAPVAVGQVVTTDEDVPVGITLAGSDIDGDALTYVVVSGPTKGELLGEASNLEYVPNLEASGSDSFTYKVNDGTVDSAVVTVSITVTPVNDAPVAGALSLSTEEDTTLFITLQGFDAEGAALTYTVVGQPANGTLSGEGTDLEYVPNPDFNGKDSFTYRVSDGVNVSGVARVSITVTPVEDIPVGQAATVRVVAGNSVAVKLEGFDGDKDALTYTVTSQPTKGTLSGTAPNLVYKANADAKGTDSFTFRVNDGKADSSRATVTIGIAEASKLTISAFDRVANRLTFEVRAPEGVSVRVESGTSLGTWSATPITATGKGLDQPVPVTLSLDRNVPVRFWRLKEQP